VKNSIIKPQHSLSLYTTNEAQQRYHKYRIYTVRMHGPSMRFSGTFYRAMLCVSAVIVVIHLSVRHGGL